VDPRGVRVLRKKKDDDDDDDDDDDAGCLIVLVVVVMGTMTLITVHGDEKVDDCFGLSGPTSSRLSPGPSSNLFLDALMREAIDQNEKAALQNKGDTSSALGYRWDDHDARSSSSSS
jgi:hypothetical protein